MIRIEIARRVLVKQGKGRNKIDPVSVLFEATLEEALAEVARWQEVTEDSATMPFMEARLYKQDDFLRQIYTSHERPKPFQIITA
jgi:hypothetical protein